MRGMARGGFANIMQGERTMNKLWAGRSEAETSALADAFNSSIAVDGRMYRQDINGSMAHAAMLAKCGILTQADTDAIIDGLAGILADLESGALQLDPQAEDIHMFVEAELTKRIGDVGKKLHTARSRNDQVALDLRMYLKDEIKALQALVLAVMQALHTQAEANKGYGNSFTTPCDVTDRRAAQQVLLSLCETVGMRLRRDFQAGSCVTVQLRSCEFSDSSRQRQLGTATNVTQELYRAACEIFDSLWDGKTPLRQLGVQVTQLSDGRFRQYSLFDEGDYDRLEKLDTAVDAIREKFGEKAIVRATFLSGETESMAGGLSKERRTGVTKPV